MRRYILLRLTDQEVAVLCDALSESIDGRPLAEATPAKRHLLTYLGSRLLNVRHTSGRR